MLTKKFKSNKFYEVTRYFFKYGHDYDEIDGNTTVWDSLEKAKSFIEKYRFNRKFYSATVEEITVDREITVEDYRSNNYEIIASRKMYEVTLEGVENNEPEPLFYYKQINEKQEENLGYAVNLKEKFNTLKEALAYAAKLADKEISREIVVYKIKNKDFLTDTYFPIAKTMVEHSDNKHIVYGYFPINNKDVFKVFIKRDGKLDYTNFCNIKNAENFYNDTPKAIIYKNNKKYKINEFDDIYSSLITAKKDARFFSRINNKTYDIYDLITNEKVCSVDYYDTAEYRIYIGNDKYSYIKTTGLKDSVELAKAYAKEYAGEKIKLNDEFENTVQEFFEDKNEPISNSETIHSKNLTKEDWDKSHQDFTCLANAGDTVDEDIVQYFRDCLPPVAHNATYLQCGEPYTHETNPKTGKWEPAFITFAKELDSWVYKGICFYRERQDVG